jgi:hypothetical protein
MPVDEYSTRFEGPTPNGGAYAIAYWIASNGDRATRETATAVETVEFDADDRVIRRTYATLTPKPSADIFPEGENG